jgi:hypothetical protein
MRCFNPLTLTGRNTAQAKVRLAKLVAHFTGDLRIGFTWREHALEIFYALQRDYYPDGYATKTKIKRLDKDYKNTYIVV